jgi:hypothetical protein
MKNLNRFLLIIVCFTFFCCDNEYPGPNAITYNVVTNNATDITKTSAAISFTISPVYSGEYGIFLSEDPNFDGYTIHRNFDKDSYYVNLSDLDYNTTYYYKAYIGGIYGEYIFGNVLSFTTKDIIPTITTGNAVIKSKTYISEGYTSNGITYYYKFNIDFPITITGAIKFTECGIYLIDKETFFNASSIINGTNTINLITYCTASTLSYNYKAYGKLTDGSYIYGEIKSLYLSYY